MSHGLRSGLDVQWETDTGLFGFEAFNFQPQISAGLSPERKHGVWGPDSRAGTLELNLQDDILPDVRTLSSQSY